MRRGDNGPRCCAGMNHFTPAHRKSASPRKVPTAVFLPGSCPHLVTQGRTGRGGTRVSVCCVWLRKKGRGPTNAPWERSLPVCLVGLQHGHAPVVVHLVAGVHRRCTFSNLTSAMRGCVCDYVTLFSLISVAKKMRQCACRPEKI